MAQIVDGRVQRLMAIGEEQWAASLFNLRKFGLAERLEG